MSSDLREDNFKFEDIFEEYVASSSLPVVIKPSVVAECYRSANSQVNLAVQLVRRCYSRKERATSNCAGRGKKQLSPRRLTAIKEVVYSVYPVHPGQKEEDAWKVYRRVIDSSCRQLNRPTLKSIFH